MNQKQIPDANWDNLWQPRTLKGAKKTDNVLFVEEYIRENVRQEWEGIVSIKALTTDFRAWALAKGRMPADGGTPTLGHVLRRVVPDLCRTYRDIDGKSVRVYQNIILNPRWHRGEAPAS